MKNNIIGLLLTIMLLTGDISPASAASRDTNPLFEMIETTAKNIKSQLFQENKVAALTTFCRISKTIPTDYYKAPGLLQAAILYGMPLYGIKLLVEKGANQESPCFVDLTQNTFDLRFSTEAKPLNLSPLELLNTLLEELNKDLVIINAIPVGTKGFVTNELMERESSIEDIKGIIEYLNDTVRKRTMSGEAFAESSSSSVSSDESSSCKNPRTQKKARHTK